MPYTIAKYYDDIYAAADKDYKGEARIVRKLARQYQASKGKRLLDVGCGTGMHASLLRRYYDIQGLDLEPAMLAIARKNNPGIQFHEGDMVDFQLAERFDVITCLFSAIGHVCTKARLRRAVKNMAAHLAPGGVLLVEPWFSAEQWHVGRVGTIEVAKPEITIVRMSRSTKKGNISILDFQYLIGTAKGIEYETEVLELGLFEHEDYMEAFQRAGLHVTHDPEGLDGRGLYIGVKPQDGTKASPAKNN
jgi:SAM-dependent methyltransferase